jgi:antirestriction protein ArdC
VKRIWPVVFLFVCGAAVAVQRPPLRWPVSGDTVVATLPPTYAGVAGHDAAQLLELGARTGDSRLIDRALAMYKEGSTRAQSQEGLLVRAWVAQHRHRFDLALSLLDRLLAQEPGHASALEIRTQIKLTGGALRAAAHDCARLALLVDAGRGLYCAAAIADRRGHYDAAVSLLNRLLMQPSLPVERQRQALVLRAEIRTRIGCEEAEHDWQQALALGDGDVRTLRARARALRQSARADEVLRLLPSMPADDGLLLERALAERELGNAEAAAAATRELGRRYALLADLGVAPEPRDHAEWLLSLRDEAFAALEAAQRNFSQQREREDVDLLRRAAVAAGQPAALETLRAWQDSEGLVESVR